MYLQSVRFEKYKSKMINRASKLATLDSTSYTLGTFHTFLTQFSQMGLFGTNNLINPDDIHPIEQPLEHETSRKKSLSMHTV